MAVLENKVAIVTGAAMGLGEAIVTRFAKEGARVLAVDREEARFPVDIGIVETLKIDLTDDDAPARIIDAVRDAFGALDILVNNAGIAISTPFEDETLENWNRIFAVNVTAPFRLSQVAVPLMKQRGGGRIVNLGSILSDLSQPAMTAYTASKHAVAGMSKGMAIDLAASNITVNYIQPGVILTPMASAHMTDPAVRHALETVSPMHRLGDPAEVAAAALFLASDQASFTTGSGLRVCGGAAVTL
jgi:NAD(P)-dependent dehydrogenase (short-subunit alcohol dehydrogenase family)